MIQEKKKHKKTKKPSAMAQVHNKVNAGVMDGVVYGGMMEAAEPEDEEYEIGLEEGGMEPYGHAVNESTDCVRFDGYHFDCYDRHALPFMSLVRKDGSKGTLFVGPVGGLHGGFETDLYASHKITPDEYGRPSELKIDGRRTGRFWFDEGVKIISFYSYPDNPKQIYDNCVEALSAVQEATGKDFNIGETMVDLWTKSVKNPIIMPVRWFDNGTAEIFLPITEKCEPYENFDGTFRYRLSTSKGNFTADWKGDDIEQEEEYGALHEGVLTESPDVVDFYGLESRDSEARSFMYVLANRKFYIGEPGETHDKMVERLEQSEPEAFEKFGSDGGDITKQVESLYDLSLTGRYWGKYNIISFWKTPVSKRNNIAFVLDEFKKQDIINDTEHTLLDYWDRPGEHKPMLFPVKWLFNGTFNTFVNYYGCTGIEPADVKCVEFKLDTKKHGILYTDINGTDVKSMFEYYGYNNYEMDESVRSALSESKEHNFDYNKYIRSLIEFMREQHLRIDPLPEIELNPEEQDGIFVKTGYYSPEERKVVVFIDGRHPKDVLRTVAHEFIHHMQNLQNPDKDWGTGGDLEADRKLRGIEGEAFLLGNIIFREWTEKMKKTKELNESINVKKALKDLKERRDPDNIENWDRIDEIEAEIVEPDDVDLSSFNIKKHLNPKFWDDGHLDTRIRLRLLDIADDFFHFLDVDWVEPEDIIITGSLANYNWNKKYSDIDLHILIDYEDVDERVDFVREYFTMKKNEWNEKHKNLRIFGFPVEVYVQDANETHASSGVYSIDRDEWLTEPDVDRLRAGKVDKRHVREMVSTYMNKIDDLVDIYKRRKDDEYEMRKVSEDAARMFDEIKKTRKDDLARYGREMCDGNIIFKALRRSDYIGKLIKLKNLTYDKINSL